MYVCIHRSRAKKNDRKPIEGHACIYKTLINDSLTSSNTRKTAERPAKKKREEEETYEPLVDHSLGQLRKSNIFEP